MAKINLKNIKAYLQGNTRSLLRSVFPDALPDHIEEQFAWRCEMAKECLKAGKCKVCGCSTPELFLASKACENNPPCYPEMMDKETWDKFEEL
jgi:hypothetical protein